jgi:hypothetical protein
MRISDVLNKLKNAVIKMIHFRLYRHGGYIDKSFFKFNAVHCMANSILILLYEILFFYHYAIIPHPLCILYKSNNI